MSALAALLVVYIAALSAVSRNPADLPPHGVQLITQAVNVTTLFVLIVMTQVFNRKCTAPSRFTWSWVTVGVLLANLVIRTVVVFSLKNPQDNLQARFTRWDTAAAVIGSLAVFVEIYYALVPRARFRTTFFILGLLFVVPLITSVPYLFGGGADPDPVVLRQSAQASNVAYDVYDEDKGPRSRVHVHTSGGVLYIAFAGTENSTDAKVDLKIGDVRVPHEWTRPTDPDVRAHQGFTELYATVRPAVLDALRAKPKDVTLVVMCGHSLGGALATLAALDAASADTHGQVHMYSFGAPQVGDGAFVELFDARVPKAVRVVNPFDPVTRSLSAQLLHTKGNYPVTSLTMDFPPASHLMEAYIVAIERPAWLRVAGVFAPLVYIGIAAIVVVLARHMLLG
jgi:rhodanese-related sulfurtransferase